MKLFTISTLFIIMAGLLTAQDTDLDWSVLKVYNQNHIQKIKMPVGGIGTGTISLTGRGALEDWEIMNRPAKGFNPTLENWGPVNVKGPFFTIFIEDGNGKKQTRLLEGLPDESYYEGKRGARSNSHGLPRFNNAEFKTAYPFGQVSLKDKKLPVEVVVRAYNPLIPGNNEAEITVVSGSLDLESFTLKGVGTKKITTKTLNSRKSIHVKIL